MGDRNTGSAPLDNERSSDRPLGACADDDVLGRVLHVASNDSPEADVVADALDELVSALGLSRASLAIVRDVDDIRRLDPVAAAGEHASFARDMPAVPLEQMAEAAVVVTERRALYVEDVHGLGERTGETDTGVGRWRSGMSTQAHAVLPVIARGSVIGILTVQWATPQAFTAGERHSLEAVALLFGLILESAAERPATSGPAEDEEHSGEAIEGEASLTVEELPSGLEVLRYAVSADGVVLPTSPGLSHGARPGSALDITVLASEPTSTSAPFWDVVGLGGGSFFAVAGIVQTPRGGADTLAASVSREMRAAMSRGAAPGAALSGLNGWLVESGPGSAWVSAGCWRFNLTARSLSYAFAGAVASASLGRDGRSTVATSEADALGAVARVTLSESVALALPGDTLAICAGSVAWTHAEAGQRALSQLMAQVSTAGAERVAAKLISATTDESTASVAMLAEVAPR